MSKLKTSNNGFGRKAYKKPEERIVGWGKYRGELMKDVPTSYLKWFVGHAYSQMSARKEYAEQELQRRADPSQTTNKKG